METNQNPNPYAATQSTAQSAAPQGSGQPQAGAFARSPINNTANHNTQAVPPQAVEQRFDEQQEPRPVSLIDKAYYWSDRLKWFFGTFAARLGKPVETIYRVGVERFREGEFADAATRFRIVVRFHPRNAEAWYLLGSCEVILDNSAEAVKAFKQTLAINPAHEEARFLLATIAPHLIPEADRPRIAPMRLVVEHFEAAAPMFDEEQLDGMGYRGHEVTAQAIANYLNPNYTNFNLLDIGCGTGLVGLLFRGVASRIEGVDISPSMLAQAEARRDELSRRIYDRVTLKDLRLFLLEQEAGGYDIITASNVFHSVGGLTPVFDGIGHALKPGGIVSFSVEPYEGGDFGFIQGSGRFGHSDAYVREQAARVGLDVLEVIPFEIYFDAEAVQYVLRKPMPAAAAEAPPVVTPPTPQTPPVPPFGEGSFS